ncbi:MAG: carboxypeptidase regulatory-like domain-containing protein [Dehalococcoidia bacterium]|nr:carboxypeptidase regulatory-like domain-containing protein [Dehalococcoidia bacterium]
MKLLSVILLTVPLASTAALAVAAESPEAGGARTEDVGVAPPMDVVLTCDRIVDNDVLGHRHIQYGERTIDDVIHVKNDYIVIHVDLETNETILYERRWRDFEFESPDITPFEPPGGDYFWKEVMLFVDEEDRCFFEGSPFYTFFDAPEYPLACWEVRYTDGTTLLYDLDGNEIGYGVPVPSSTSSTGYLVSGTHYGDPREYLWWIPWRNNAESWYSKWTDSTVSVHHPETEDIRNHVENPDTRFYYAIGHGSWRTFQASKKGEDGKEYRYDYYRAAVEESGHWVESWAYEDMANRDDAMLFAFLGHCEGMTKTDPPSFSHAFRTGELEGVTVGYDEIHKGPWQAWTHAGAWQNRMFEYMDEGHTVWEAFWFASAEYPVTGEYVAFAGDERVVVTGLSGVRGHVGNAETGLPLSGAKVEVDETEDYVYTDSAGYYEIPLAPGAYTLTASYMMFYDKTYTVEVLPDRLIQRSFWLQPEFPGFPIPEVTPPGNGLVEEDTLWLR